MEASKNVNEKHVGKLEELFITQYAYDLKVEDLKSLTNPNAGEKKITLHIYSNNPKTIVNEAKAIYDDAQKRFK
jgi:hypothetical protein